MVTIDQISLWNIVDHMGTSIYCYNLGHRLFPPATELVRLSGLASLELENSGTSRCGFRRMTMDGEHMYGG
jgi:hypothetical protein